MPESARVRLSASAADDAYCFSAPLIPAAFKIRIYQRAGANHDSSIQFPVCLDRFREAPTQRLQMAKQLLMVSPQMLEFVSKIERGENRQVN